MRSAYKEIWGFLEQGDYQTILLVSFPEIISEIKQKFPAIRIYTTEKELVTEKNQFLKGKKINQDLDVIKDLTANSFDCIIVGYILEEVETPVAFVKRLLPYLKIDGDFLASFNSRHYRTKECVSFRHIDGLNQVMQTKMHNGRKVFSLSEIAGLFEKAKCKEIKVFSLEEELPPVCGNTHQKILKWGICANKVNKMVLFLRKSFTKEIREAMVFFLRRIENEIFLEKSCLNLCNLCNNWKVSNSYLIKMIANTMISPDKVIALYAVYLYEVGEHILSIDLLWKGYDIYQKSENILVVLITLLNVEKRWPELIPILQQYQGNDTTILQLQEQIKEFM